jgi:dTDP-4-dehydrorhamnose 3,5-epimerase
MNIISSSLTADLKIIQLDIYHDSRGFFVERFNKKAFIELGLPIEYYQDNFSYSLPGLIRGLHCQQSPSQAKLVGCNRGGIWDVSVDIRKNSRTFGQHFAIELSGRNGKMLYILADFTHGFCVLVESLADVIYKVDNRYSKEGEGWIAYNDPDLNIEWPVKDPIVSAKDQVLPSFKAYQNSGQTF